MGKNPTHVMSKPLTFEEFRLLKKICSRGAINELPELKEVRGIAW